MELLWTWQPRGDYTCPECASMPMYTWYKQEPPHQQCDCATWQGAFPGYMRYENVQWDDIGYSRIGQTVQSVKTNHNETPTTYEVGGSTSDAVEISVTVGSGFGFSVSDIEASISAEVTQTVSSETGVDITESVELEPGQTLVVYDITYRGELIIFADQIYVTSGGPYNPSGEVRGGIEEIGRATYTFHGFDYDIR